MVLTNKIYATKCICFLKYKKKSKSTIVKLIIVVHCSKNFSKTTPRQASFNKEQKFIETYVITYEKNQAGRKAVLLQLEHRCCELDSAHNWHWPWGKSVS